MNPMEWLSWLYGKFFTNHTTLSYVLVALVALLAVPIALVVWTRAIDKYRVEHADHFPPSPAAAQPKNTTFGAESPIMPNNSGVVNITREPAGNTSSPTKRGSKEDAGKTKTSP